MTVDSVTFADLKGFVIVAKINEPKTQLRTFTSLQPYRYRIGKQMIEAVGLNSSVEKQQCFPFSHTNSFIVQ